MNTQIKLIAVAVALVAVAWANNEYLIKPAVYKANSEWQKKWDDRNDQDSKAAAKAAADVRAKETGWQANMDQLAAKAQADKQKAAADLLTAKRESERLRAGVNAALDQLRSPDTGTDAGSQARASTRDLLANLFAKINDRSAGLAAVADESRRKGLICESAYDSLTEKQKNVLQQKSK